MEPAHCPVLHAPRDWDLAGLIEERAASLGYRPAVFRCLHLAGGVGSSSADAEELPFPPAGFDVVASVFGAMFAPRPERAAAELFRGARPGGLVAMANYDGGGLMGRVSELISSFGPPPSVDLPSPFSWGDPGEVRSRFRELASSVEVNGRTGRFEFGSVGEGVEFWERTNPPLSALRALLSEEAHRDVVAALTRLFSRLNATNDGRLVLEWGYVEVLARKPGPA